MYFKILKMIATSGFSTAVECTKFVFGRGCAPDPAGGAYSSPRPFSWFNGGPTSKGRRGQEKREEGRGRKRKDTYAL